MKLTASLFKDLVVAKMATRADVGFLPGQILNLEGGVFRVEAKIFDPKGSRFRLASLDGSKILSVEAKDLRPMSPLEVRVARFVHLAFNKDFDMYVKESVRSHGFPVDEDMDWSRWWEAKTRGKFGYAGEDLRDEAVHNLIIWALVENNKLADFDPSRLNPEIQKLPLEKQITSFLQRVFSDRLDYIYDYINNATGKGKETPGEIQTEDGSINLMDRSNSDAESAEDVHAEAEDNKIFRDFRTAFFTWLDSNESGFQKRSLEPMKVLFDLIILSDDPKPRFIAESFVELTGASKSSMRGYTEKLADALVRFSQKAPEGLINLPLVNKLKALAPSKASSLSKDASSKESNMSLEKKLAALKAKHSKKTAPKVDKYAKLRRIAEEEPEAMGDAVSELTLAFATLADAADALAENLDLVSEDKLQEEVEETTDKAAKLAKKAKLKNFKFAAAFKRIAMENPGSLADALSEVYSTLDTVAEGIENLAQNLGIELAVAPEMDEMGMADPLMDTPTLDMGADIDADLDAALPGDLTPDGDLAPKASSLRRHPLKNRARR